MADPDPTLDPPAVPATAAAAQATPRPFTWGAFTWGDPGVAWSDPAPAPTPRRPGAPTPPTATRELPPAADPEASGPCSSPASLPSPADAPRVSYTPHPSSARRPMTPEERDAAIDRVIAGARDAATQADAATLGPRVRRARICNAVQAAAHDGIDTRTINPAATDAVRDRAWEVINADPSLPPDELSARLAAALAPLRTAPTLDLAPLADALERAAALAHLPSGGSAYRCRREEIGRVEAAVARLFASPLFQAPEIAEGLAVAILHYLPAPPALAQAADAVAAARARREASTPPTERTAP